MTEHHTPPKIRILFALRALWLGGVEVALISLMNRMDFDRCEVSCLITERHTELAQRLDPRIRLIVCDRSDPDYRAARLYPLGLVPEHPSALHRAFAWTAPMFRSLEARLYARHIATKTEGRYDTAVIYDVTVAELTVRGVRADRYFMFYHHGAMGHAYHDSLGYRASEKIIVVSELICRGLQERNPKYAHKMLPIHNIIDVEGILEKAEAPQTELAPDCFRIVTCARLSQEKGVDLALRACKILLDRGMTGFHWYFVGDGRDRKQLEDMRKELGLEDCCTFLGQRDNPYPYIKNASLYALTSRAEANPLTPIEALVLHTPVLATNTAGSAEVLAQGKYGFLCATEPEAIASAIQYLLQNEDVYSDYKARAALADYNTQNIENLKKLEEQLLS